VNWKLFKYAFKSGDMRKKILVVFGMIIIFRFLSHIPIPLADPTTLRQLIDQIFNSQQLLGFLDLLSGGALSNFSIMLMGLGPYINASIVMQLLTKAIPKLEALNQEGESGRQKVNQITRWLTLPFAFLQSIGVIFLVRQQAGGITGSAELFDSTTFAQWSIMVAALVGGSMLLMWMGEIMSEQGVGNGISLIITAGIVSQLPSTIATIITLIGSDTGGIELFGRSLPLSWQGIELSLLLIFVVVLTMYFIIKLNEAQRVVKISYAKRVRGNRAYGGVDSVLPIKLITVGVIPIIFAVAFLSVPSFVGQILAATDSLRLQEIGQKLLEWFANGTGLAVGSAGGIELASLIYPAAYFFLVVVFTYFYTSIMFNPKEIAENLQKQGGFISGIRPGNHTEQYLTRIMSRLTLFGSVSLGLVAILPFIVDYFVILRYNVPISQQLQLGGTGLLIIVSVAIETLRQVESKALMVSYDNDSSITS